MSTRAVFLCGAKRTAIGSLQGALASIAAPQLGAAALEAVIATTGVPKERIDEVILGCVLAAGLGRSEER